MVIFDIHMRMQAAPHSTICRAQGAVDHIITTADSSTLQYTPFRALDNSLHGLLWVQICACFRRSTTQEKLHLIQLQWRFATKLSGLNAAAYLL